MKPRDLFGLMVRVLGLVVVLYAIWNLSFGVAFAVSLLRGTSHDADVGAYFTFGVPALVVGVILIRFGRQIVRFAYPAQREDSDAEQSDFTEPRDEASVSNRESAARGR